MISERLILASAWVALPLLVLGQTQDRAAILSGWATWISAIGAVLLTICIVISWLSERRSRPASPEALATWAWIGRSGIHLLPIFIIVVIDVRPLGAEAASLLPPPEINAGSDGVAPAPITVTGGSGTQHRTGNAGISLPTVITPSGAPELTLQDLYFVNDFPGLETVQVIGMALSRAKAPPTPVAYPADAEAFLVRFRMQCCAADATPVPVALRDRRNAQERPLDTFDGWVRVTGRWIRPSKDRPFAIVDVESVTTIDEPKFPYMSPVYR